MTQILANNSEEATNAQQQSTFVVEVGVTGAVANAEKKLEADATSAGSQSSSDNNTSSNNPTEEDPWAIVDLVDDGEKWSDMTLKRKLLRIFINTTKIVLAVGMLYLFVCSLDLLSSSFRLIAGKTAGGIFQSSTVASNPVVGLMAGILVTVLVQSSSTSTSIIVSLVGAGVLTVQMAIPIIMGSNIGTSVTNTIVSFTQIANKNEFRRAFAGATIHDMFNWLTVFVLFTVEIVTQSIFGMGYLEWISGAIVSGVSSSSGNEEIKLLKVITDPFVQLFIKLDSKVLEGWANADPKYDNSSLIKQCSQIQEIQGQNVSVTVPCNDFLFANTGLEDWAVGLILLFISLFMLCGCLVCLVKILNSMMKGHIANIIKKIINAKIPYAPWLTGYIALFVGALLTFLVQSSSVFTSTLTPLVGIGVVSLKRMYPLTLGSNIGTTTTSLLAALAASPDKLHDTLQISLCHLFFNVTGILLFYPIPFMRFPIPLAKFLGNETAKYRWYAILYLLGMFFVLPAIVLGLSLGGTIVLFCVGLPIIIVLIAIGVIKIIQKKRPHWLPSVLQNWKWLPVCCRSLEPYDRQFSRCACCNKFRPDDAQTGSAMGSSTETIVIEIQNKDEAS